MRSTAAKGDEMMGDNVHASNGGISANRLPLGELLCAVFVFSYGAMMEKQPA